MLGVRRELSGGTRGLWPRLRRWTDTTADTYGGETEEAPPSDSPLLRSHSPPSGTPCHRDHHVAQAGHEPTHPPQCRPDLP